MTASEIELKVRDIIAKKFDIGSELLTADTNLANDIGLDSFAAVELMFELEQAFDLKIPDSDIAHIRTIGDIVVYLEKWMKARGSP